jgi:hypothetical protein
MKAMFSAILVFLSLNGYAYAISSDFISSLNDSDCSSLQTLEKIKVWYVEEQRKSIAELNTKRDKIAPTHPSYFHLLSEIHISDGHLSSFEIKYNDFVSSCKQASGS